MAAEDFIITAAHAPLGPGAEQFRMLAENIPTLCWMAAPDGYITWYNRRWHEYCGTTPEQMQGWGWQGVHDPAILPDVMAKWTDCIKNGRPFEMVFPLRGVDGGFRPFLTRVQPLQDANGGVLGWFGINTEITAQAEAEQALRQANAKLARNAAERNAILSQLAEGVIITDAQGTITFVNEAAARLHGTAQLEVGPDQYSQAYSLLTEDRRPYPPNDLPLARAAQRGETVTEATWRVRRPDGSEVLAIGNALPVRDADGSVFGAVLTVRDETARREAQLALQQSEATVRAFFETNDMHRVIVDLEDDDAVFVLTNRHFASAWGRASIDGMRASAVIGGPVATETMALLHRRHALGCASTREFPFLSKNGPRWYLATLNPMPAGPEGRKRLAAAILDITERKHAEQALAQALQTKEVLLQEVNHRVKNSLQLVMSLLQMHARHASDPRLEAVLAEARGRIGVVASMHQGFYVGARHGHDEIDFGAYANALAGETLSALASDRPIRLDFSADPDIIMTLDQAVPLALILNELLTNSVKYAFPGDSGGTITLRLSAVDNGITMELGDDGVGFPEGFDPARGTGLGMRIVTALTRQIKARAEVLRKEHTTGFRITLQRW